ncbi:Similar to 4-carboxymuconolactone decarboxylase; acc. no. P20370 [Pyronema omphalodes CBS 100304]|uniref:Similar to 4-carboxymuconolactone decarboxylase acc. no. P20370 n=1 Tax=Pyronema omphalodes (strain CBS 100304) TaxID=1076935 RepID=U4LPB3_PYROM|nr:Similar to 4-carboxymuconolactone decarboxylase; acc. no. P20370 [Pyronema omphalodes CBS 100304]
MRSPSHQLQYPSHIIVMSQTPTAEELAAAHATIYAAGIAMRRAVVGPAHVERSLANASEFSMPIQDLVTEACWGQIWTRPGLDRKIRSFINMAMLCALNRSPELALHVRGAVANGATEDEIREVLLQVAVYCGMPAGLEGTKVADRVLGEIRKENGQKETEKHKGE